MKIILATTSPYRIEAMKFLGIPFETRASNIDEYFDGRPNTPEALVKCLSKLKAEAVAKTCLDSLVLGMDSVGYFKEKILEKPKSKKEAYKRLRKLSGNTHEFHTGITLINTNTSKVYYESALTVVTLRYLNHKEIKNYLKNSSDYMNHALGYNPLDGLSATFIRSIDGDMNNLLRGIPLATVVEMIKENYK